MVTDLYRLSGDKVQEEEGYRLHTSFSQSLLKDHFQSSQLSEHGLIHVRKFMVILILPVTKIAEGET